MTIFQGDFFRCPFEKFDFIYDRAAYVALPVIQILFSFLLFIFLSIFNFLIYLKIEIRPKYFGVNANNLSGKGCILLRTLYKPEKTDGPPFHIPFEEIETNCKNNSLEVKEIGTFDELIQEKVLLISKL